MKLSVSNIAWTKENDDKMYQFLADEGIQGLEIAPTRIFPELPYEKLADATTFAEGLKHKYGLVIPSMQSIWFGRSENIFASKEERDILLGYTKKAIDFAAAVGCRNLVFGCPRNRAYTDAAALNLAIPFFKELGDYAFEKGTVLSMEANPVIYNTNYCNTTQEALDLIKAVDSRGFMLNLDLGTMVYNEESIAIVHEAVDYINHVHISEPGLALIQKRSLHEELAEYLVSVSYDGFVSLEIKTQENVQDVKDMVYYLKDVFGR